MPRNIILSTDVVTRIATQLKTVQAYAHGGIAYDAAAIRTGIYIMSGAIPASADAVTYAVPTPLASIVFTPTTTVSAPTPDVIRVNTSGTYTAATGTGTATWAYLYLAYSNSATYSMIMLMSVTGPGGGGDIILPNTAITAGNLFTIANFDVTLPTSVTY